MMVRGLRRSKGTKNDGNRELVQCSWWHAMQEVQRLYERFWRYVCYGECCLEEKETQSPGSKEGIRLSGA